MGIFSRIRFASQAERYGQARTTRALATPFMGPTHLDPAIVIADDLFKAQAATVTRAEAMSVPAVARGRHLIAGLLARYPLVAYSRELPVREQPAYLSRSAYYPPRLRILWTLDDLIFYGWSLWVLDRGAPDGAGGRKPVLDALRVAPELWRQDEGRIFVRLPDGTEQEVPAGEYLLIPGPSEGILTAGAHTIRGARQLEDQWLARVRNPVPVTEIRYTGDEDLEEGEMRQIRDTYIAARADENGTVMVTPKGFEVHPHGDAALDLFVNGRNAVTIDVARLLNLPASQLDASNVNASSVNYQNTDVSRSALVDWSLRTWALSLEEALSQDDVLPRGQYVQFDLSALVTHPDPGTGPTLED